MAAPVNTLTSLNMVGIREDLSDRIYDISPEATPFYSKCAKMKATNTLHEWQTDALRASADNAHLEGDDTVAASRTPTVRLGNYTQIFKDAVVVAGTDDGLNKAGRGLEMAKETVKIAKEQKLDIEKALFANQAKSAQSGGTPRRLAGVPAWLTTNVTNMGGGGGADPTGDGSDARTDGSQTALVQGDFDSLMQEIWTSGGRAQMKSAYVSPFNMNLVLAFVGNNNARKQDSKAEVSNMMDFYVTPWGKVEWIPSLESRSRDLLVMQDDMWGVAVLRGTKNEALAKTGDSEKRQVVTELTLVCKNEKASGIVADLTTS
jgi:hypothetical protein